MTVRQTDNNPITVLLVPVEVHNPEKQYQKVSLHIIFVQVAKFKYPSF